MLKMYMPSAANPVADPPADGSLYARTGDRWEALLAPTVVDFRDFTTDLGGAHDRRAELQAAIDQARDANALLYIPKGVVTVDGEVILRDGAVRIRGDGPGRSILRVGIGTGNAAGTNCSVLWANEGAGLTTLELRGLTFKGGLYHTPYRIEGPAGDRTIPIRLGYVDDLVMDDCEVLGSRTFLLKTSRCARARVTNSRFAYAMQDGCAIWGSTDVVVDNCNFRHTGDDALSFNSFTPSITGSSRVTVTNNHFFGCQGMVALAMNQVNISHNHFTLCRARAILVGRWSDRNEADMEARRTVASLNICNNTISDLLPNAFTREGAGVMPIAIEIRSPEYCAATAFHASGDDAVYAGSEAGNAWDAGFFLPPWNCTDGANANFRGAHQVNITGNIIGRTRPNGRPSSWSGQPYVADQLLPQGLFCHVTPAELGAGGWAETHGVVFNSLTQGDATRPGAWIDPVVSDLTEQASPSHPGNTAWSYTGISVLGPVTGLKIADNSIDGGMYDALRLEARTGWTDAVITGNEFRSTRMDRPLVRVYGAAWNQDFGMHIVAGNPQARLYFADNLFEPDPYNHPRNRASGLDAGVFATGAWNNCLKAIQAYGIGSIVMGPGNRFARTTEVMVHDASTQVTWLDGQILFMGYDAGRGANTGVHYPSPNGGTAVWPQFRVVEVEGDLARPDYRRPTTRELYVQSLDDALPGDDGPWIMTVGLRSNEINKVLKLNFTLNGAAVADLPATQRNAWELETALAATLTASAPGTTLRWVCNAYGYDRQSYLFTIVCPGPIAVVDAAKGAFLNASGATVSGNHGIAGGAFHWWAGEVFTLGNGRRFRVLTSGPTTGAGAATFAWLD